VEIDGKAVDFDETAVTDLEVLCYYTHSDFFQGLDEERAAGCAPTLAENSVFSGQEQYGNTVRPAWATIRGTAGQLEVTFASQWSGSLTNGRWATRTRPVVRTPSGGYEVDGTPATIDASGLFEFTAVVNGSVSLDFAVRLVPEPIDVTGQYATTINGTPATIDVIQDGTGVTAAINLQLDPPRSVELVGEVVGGTFGAGDGCWTVTGTVEDGEPPLIDVDAGGC
jgi:hypothetical protein